MKHITYDFDGKGERWFDLYTQQECIQEFWPIAETIFCHETHWNHLNTLTKFPFTNPTWTLVMLAGDVGDELIYDEDQLIEPNENEPGKNTKERTYDRDELAPLWEILSEDGVEEVVLCDVEKLSDQPDDSYQIGAAIFPPKREFVYVPYINTGFVGASPHYLFDQTKRWGAVGMMEDECLLGGDPDLMTRFIEKAGGLSELQHRFRAHVINGYSLYPYDLSNWRRIYEIVGWSFPFEGAPKERGHAAEKFIDSQR